MEEEATIDEAEPALNGEEGESKLQTAPNTEFKRLPSAALGIFSPNPARKSDGFNGSATFTAGTASTPSDLLNLSTAGPDMCTPRRRNTVLSKANPEMINTLNNMFGSPAATPGHKHARASMFGATPAAGTAGAAMNAISADGAPAVDPQHQKKLEAEEKKRKESKKMTSVFLLVSFD